MEHTSGQPLEPSPAALPPKYGYFVVQSRWQDWGDGSDLDGVIENLSTGERRDFRSVAEIARLVAHWAMGAAENDPLRAQPNDQGSVR